MRRYQGAKVLYFSYPSMLRTEPFRWLIYLVLTVIGAGVLVFMKFRFPDFFDSAPLKWLPFILVLGPGAAGAALFARWWFDVYGKRLLLTSDEAIFIKGVFNTSMTEIRLSDIRAVEVDQTFWDKLMGIGAIRIASAGSDGWEIEIKGLPNPAKVRRIINEGRHGANSDD